jgi:hypothetical protein
MVLAVALVIGLALYQCWSLVRYQCWTKLLFLEWHRK